MTEDLSKLGLSELYNELIPPSAPTDISMLPQTVGWIWLAGFLILGIGYLLLRWVRYRRSNAYRREAIKALKQAGEDPIALATVLRKTALAAFPRGDVAGLIGDNWLAFLDETAGKQLFLGTSAGKTLTRAPYQTCARDAALSALAKEWVTSHKAEPAQKRGEA